MKINDFIEYSDDRAEKASALSVIVVGYCAIGSKMYGFLRNLLNLTTMDSPPANSHFCHTFLLKVKSGFLCNFRTCNET